ncbi:MAG: hypothetical protein ACHQ1G_11080 [Planctomycetota bacterium]
MRLAVGLLLLLCGCGHGPYGPFDAGHDVHVILLADPAPSNGLWVAPVITIGPEAVTSPPRLLKAGEAPAVEVAVLRAPTGRHSFSIWVPRPGVGARADLDVKQETWVVMEMRPKDREGRLRVYDKPPAKKIGPYVQLVPVPD